MSLASDRDARCHCSMPVTTSEATRLHGAIAEERRRWARELHDETLQNLAAMRLTLAGARRTAGAGALTDAVDEVLIAIEDEIASLRSLIMDVRPPALQRLGLEAAIFELAQRATQRGVEVGVSVGLGADDGRRDQLNIAIFRIVQEAINNVLEHSGATRAVVAIVERHQRVQIVVSDDGHGFRSGAATTGLGLLGIRERAEQFGGTLRISSTPRRGAEITATLRVPTGSDSASASRSPFVLAPRPTELALNTATTI